jgi:tripartite-type tricarboxylate transporter receptor subunit TctC
MNKNQLLAFVGAAFWSTLCAAQLALEYPLKPIVLVVPFAAGSGTDNVARTLAKDMQEVFKQAVIVENRPGANGATAASYVARAKPDGYTLIVGSATTHATNYALSIISLGYGPKSFDMISGLSSSPIMLFAAQNYAPNNANELIADAKKNIGRLSCGSGNAVTQVACEVFKKSAGVFAVTIPYRSNAQALQDVAGGQISFAFSDPSAALWLLESKRIKPIAITSTQKPNVFKNVQSFAQAGFPELQITAWTGVFAPVGVPRAIIDKLNAAIKRSVESEESQRLRSRAGSLSLYMTPEESKQFVDSEILRWAKYVSSTGVKPE